ncbi:MAG TPA: diguanylate phosphodiesterase, partial [Thermoanaerobaculia bacterium]|nr:diguanylate phosphodiesterase [Thermoanaerobaculia bacterium]
GMVGHTGERFVISESAVHPFGREEQLTACIPLKLDDRVVGVIGIFRLLQQKQGLEPLDFELFDLLSSHAASALFCTRTQEVLS